VLSLWFFNVRIELFKKFRDASSLAFIFGILESRVRRTADDGSVITGEVVLRKKFTNFKFDKFKKLFVIDEVALVKEDYDSGYTYLASEQNVLTRLRHGTVGSGHDKNRSVHLGRTRNHVLYVISVTRAVNVGVVPIRRLVFHVAGCDSKNLGWVTTTFRLRRFRDFIVGN
jgi:hypothetical protein